MNFKQVIVMYFSPTNTTKNVLETLLSSMGIQKTIYDLTDFSKDNQTYTFEENDLIVLGTPVYSGRVPKIFLSRIQNLRGNNTPIALVITYGNRAYDDALFELKNVVEEKGFRVIGAAACVAEHSVVRTIAKGRPNSIDIEEIKGFGKHLFEKMNFIESVLNECELNVKGNSEYRKYISVPFKPHTTKSCIQCGVCALKCPAGAISIDNPNHTNKDICISCMRCVKLCPKKARNLYKYEELLAKAFLHSKCKEEKQTEIFL